MKKKLQHTEKENQFYDEIERNQEIERITDKLYYNIDKIKEILHHEYNIQITSPDQLTEIEYNLILDYVSRNYDKLKDEEIL